MEFIDHRHVGVLSKPGIESHQLLFPENSSSSRVTITKVVISPGGINPRHRHETSEQVWVALAGAGHLLLDGERTVEPQMPAAYRRETPRPASPATRAAVVD